MNYFYKVSANLTTRVIKRAEKKVSKICNLQFEWSFNYFSKHWFISFKDYLFAFKTKYKVKNIEVNSFLYNELKSQYLGYKDYLENYDTNNYEDYLNCVKDKSVEITKH